MGSVARSVSLSLNYSEILLKCIFFRCRALELMFIKVSSTLMVHKTPSIDLHHRIQIVF
jgi:hypothetical protein